jgi:hypothetical protein
VEIIASHGGPLIPTTSAVNFPTPCTAGVVNTGGKFATGVLDNDGKFATEDVNYIDVK